MLLVWGLLGLPFPQWTSPSQRPGRVLQFAAAVQLAILAILNIPGVISRVFPNFPWVPYSVPFLSLGAQYLFYLGLCLSLYPWVAPSVAGVPPSSSAGQAAVDGAAASPGKPSGHRRRGSVTSQTSKEADPTAGSKVRRPQSTSEKERVTHA